MTHLLQTYVDEFGPIITNAFDLNTWTTATTLKSVRLKIEVLTGSVQVDLRHISALNDVSLGMLTHEAAGVSETDPIILEGLSGYLIPVVLSQSDEADFKISFVTNDAPSRPDASVNFVICTFKRPAYVQKNAAVFETFMADSGLSETVHLTIVDNAGDCGVSVGPHISVFQNENTGGAGGFGRGMYESCYGDLKARSFSHVCLMDDDIYLHAEMFARNVALLAYLKPDWHIGAPMYPASSTSQVPRKSACFGHRYKGTVHPSDKSLMGGLDTAMVGDFVGAKRTPDTTGWWWNCISTDHIRQVGLPYPFFVKMDDVEYSLRLKDAGIKLAVPTSFWVLHDDFDEKYSAVMQYYRFRNRIIMLMLRSTLPKGRKFTKRYFKEVSRFIRAAQYEHAELMLMGFEDILKGPDYIVENSTEILKRVIDTVKVEKNVPMPDTPDGAMVAQGTQTIKSTQAGRRVVTRWNGPAKVGFQVVRDPKRTAAAMARMALAMFKTRLLRQAGREFRASQDHLKSPAFWETYGRIENRPEPQASLVVADPPLPPVSGLGEVTDRDQIFLNTIRNAHLGKRCFVIGNGPSLTVADLELLQNEYTFAANKIYLSFAETHWRPTYYSVEDRLVAANNRERITELTGTTKIFPSHIQEFIPPRPNHFFVKWRPPRNNKLPYREFSSDLTRGVCWGSTITYTLMQMAVHMGFKEIYLIGIDHSYVESAKTDGNALISAGEVNHFHADYRKPGERWNYPVLDRLESSYAYARRYCDENGVKVYNASRKTQLDAFELRDLDEVLGLSGTG